MANHRRGISRRKESIRELAIFGGEPLFSDVLHVNRPSVGDRASFDRYIDAAWESCWFTNNGPLVRELENRIQRYLDVRHCVLTCNGTQALALVIKALNLTGEVIVPSFTFVSTAHTLVWHNIQPVFCDIDPTTWTIDGRHCETLITDRTTAIVGTHIWGQACGIASLQELATRKGTSLVFDAAHAFGCTHQGEKIGRFGNAEVFSLHATKVFHTFEGGAITTNDDRLADVLRTMRNFGFSGYDEISMLGTNAKMSEASAAMGLANLESVAGFIARNRACHDLYRRRLAEIPGIELYRYTDCEDSNHQYVPIEVSDETGVSRDTLMKVLHAERVLTRRYFYPGVHLMEPYRSRFPHADSALPQTRRIASRVLVLPTGPSLSDEDIVQVCELIRFVMDHGDRITERLVADEDSRAG